MSKDQCNTPFCDTISINIYSYKCPRSLLILNWNGNNVILIKFLSLAALKVVTLTTSTACRDENFIKMMTFLFQCRTLLNTFTHWGREQMAAILQATFSNMFFQWKSLNFNSNFPEVCSKASNSLINKSAGVQLMTWHWTCDKQLSESMMTQFNEAHIHHLASMSQGLNNQADKLQTTF